jgi:hypothetical protein
MFAGVGVVGAIAGGAGESAAAAPTGRWWTAQTILSGTVSNAGNLGLGVSRLGGFLLAGAGQASHCAPGAVAFSSPVATPLGLVASGTPTFGPGAVGASSAHSPWVCTALK